MLFSMKSYTLLCVDDDSGIRELYELLLTSFGYEVWVAEDGRSALELFRSKGKRIDAVILDYQMPEMNGVELATELKRERPNLPVIMISGSHPDLEKKSEFVDVALPKGVDIEKVITQLEALLDNTRSPGGKRPRAGVMSPGTVAVPS